MLAGAGICWQVLAYAGRCWEVRRNGVSLCDFVRSLKNSTEFDIMVQHALLPIRGRRSGYAPFRRPLDLILWFDPSRDNVVL